MVRREVMAVSAAMTGTTAKNAEQPVQSQREAAEQHAELLVGLLRQQSIGSHADEEEEDQRRDPADDAATEADG